jgi:NADH-quinone oxidoreductase subunit B
MALEESRGQGSGVKEQGRPCDQASLGARVADSSRKPRDQASLGARVAGVAQAGFFQPTRLDALVSWCRTYSLWPMPFATACCGIELMATGASRHDIARFGAEVFRFSPRQCDLMIVAGRVVMKMLPVLQRIWQQMPEPKWCISMGACASTGGVFDTYCVVQGIDRFVPVDIYVPGCPPRPEQLIQSLVDLQQKIQREGTLWGKEFDAPRSQQPKRALQEK